MKIYPLVFTALLLLSSVLCIGANQKTKNGPLDSDVTLVEEADYYTLSNGQVKLVVSKKNGNISSISYHGRQVLASRAGRETALWSHDATSPDMIYTITIDPRSNNGLRAEISVKGISSGRPMGNGPGGSFIADIEIRYSLSRGESGIYTYCIFDHPAHYDASSMGEARFVAFLDQNFDWISVDEKRNFLYPLEKNGLDISKYSFTANQTENPAFGWINSKEKTGFWIINPSAEYMSGGPTKVDFLCHRDTKINGAPCALNYWRSSHYGGSTVNVARGEKWSKVIGPFMLYLNKGENPAAIRQDALKQTTLEQAKYPYDWVSHPDYPLKNNRGSISGKIMLKDPLTPATFSRLRVGLSAPDYQISELGKTRTVDWQYDTKFYQFWAQGNIQGEFNIPNVRPGKYTLHAIADGVLGEYLKSDIIVSAGEHINLGALVWEPVRYGKQIWDIGIANRNASEYASGDKWFASGILKEYHKNFPTGVNYTIGKSDFRKDWFFMQPPYVENIESPENNLVPETTRHALIKSLGIEGLAHPDKQTAIKVIEDLGLTGKYAKGQASSWKVNFTLKSTLTGIMILRIAICGSSARELSIRVNKQAAGKLANLRIDGAPSKSGFTGMWEEHTIQFDASLLKKGNNTLELIVPGGKADAAIMYDYLRLEHERSKL